MLRIATKEDIPFINEVLNHPKVRPHVWRGDDVLDYTDTLGVLWTLVAPGKGMMAAEALGDGNYLALVAFLPEAWGPEAVSLMRQGIRMIFTKTDCSRLYGSVKPNNLRASRNLIGMGMKEVGLNGNRITGHIDYSDFLDEDLFRETVDGGWSGKALYWWNIKAKVEDTPFFIPLDPTKEVFSKNGVLFDYTKA